MKNIISISLLLLSLTLFSQIPDYYNDVNLNLSGLLLKDELSLKITSTHVNVLSYSEIWDTLKITDINPLDNTEILLVYGYEEGSDGDSKNDRERGINSTCGTGSCAGLWNREHIFPNSLGNPDLDNSGTTGAYSDSHNLRPSDSPTNSSRGNKLFATGLGNSGLVTGGWYPGDEWKGDVARIAMYMYLRYGSQCLPTLLGVGSNASTPDDMIDLFLDWNVDDPVSDFEKQRNTFHDSNENYAQGNRNPFIDNPAFATQVWGGPQAEDLFVDFSDTQSPTIPINLVSSNITGNSFSVSWTASADNASVKGYNILLDGVISGTTNTTSYNATGLSSSAVFNVTVESYDAVGNTSDNSSSLIVHIGTDSGTTSTDLFISEYIEGSSNNKALELTNFTGNTIDLGIYSLKKQVNGGGAWKSGLSLIGKLINGDVFVIANSSANSMIIDEADITGGNQVTFNGNDPIGLFKNDALIDIIGVLNNDTDFAKDKTLRRKSSVISPNTIYTISEWESLDKDTFSGIGSHIVSGTNTFLGTTDRDWDTLSNWSFGSVPSNSNVIIKTGQTVIASGNIFVANLTLESNSKLTVADNISNSGTINLNSNASLIAPNSTEFNLTSNTYLETTKWYLISSSVKNETLQNIISSHNFATGLNSNIGIGDYVNTNPGWEYATSSSSGILSSGKGHSVKLSQAGNISFSGSMSIDNNSIQISDGGASGNGFNLIGNPYPSYITANHTSPSNSNNLLSANSGILAEQTIWFWSQVDQEYKQINQASALIDGIRHIPPGQGFFVKSNATGGDFNFYESLQSQQGVNVFNKSKNNSENYTHIKLILTDKDSKSSTDIIYLNGATSGWDNSYDSTIFSEESNRFAIYSQLAQNNQGQNLGIQSLSENNFDEIIAIGVDAPIGSEITITAEVLNLPDSRKIYLEDRLNSTFTLLDDSSKHTTILTNGIGGTGRFYLYTSNSTLNLNNDFFKSVNVFATDNKTLKIIGIYNNYASLILYDITGKKVFSSSFLGNGNNTIKLSNLKKALYIIQLKNSQGILNKKLLIE